MSFPFVIPEAECHLDPATGLPGLGELARELKQRLAPAAPVAPAAGAHGGGRAGRDFLLLLELYPQARDAGRGLAGLRRAADYLNSLLGGGGPLYSLGLGVFALVWSASNPEEARGMADKLLSRLRRENFARAHAGLVQLTGGGRQSLPVEVLLSKAWLALAVARKRGPFGLCLADSPRIFPAPIAEERAKLQRLWRGRDAFALLLVRQDQPALSNHFSKRLRQALDLMAADDSAPPVLYLSQREVLIYLAAADDAVARHWFAGFRERMRQLGGSSFSVGIALYPCLNFSKSQIPVNCRKALLHAELLGPDSLAVFNAITLNISGDAYYNEGDIRRAVAEYRQGLALDPANLNLHNSLGVALVQLQQNRAALTVFEQVLALEPANFMALGNLGFAHLAAGHDQQAIHYFERALAVNGCLFDLLLALGKLYLRNRRYREAAELLTRCVDDPKVEERRNADLATAHRLLGQALIATDQLRPAMATMEKALALNPRDAEAMSLLAELYVRNGEGDEIALALGRQAVEGEGEQRGEQWRRLGWVQWRLGLVEEADASLGQALRLNRRDSEATALLAEIRQRPGRSGSSKKAGCAPQTKE